MCVYKRHIVIAFLCFYNFSACNEKKMNSELDAGLNIEQKVDSLLNLMTLDEKIGQMSQIRHFDENAEQDIYLRFVGSVIHTEGPLPGKSAEDWQDKFIALQKKALSTRLGIPLLFAVDAIHGQNTFEGATIFPHNIGLGASRNAELVKRIAEITALETQATGFSWVFSPCIAIPYNEKWGRVFEAFSEDTNLTTKLSEASVLGHQGNLRDTKTVMATAKHFIGDGSTDFGVEGGSTTLSMEEINDFLLPPYEAAVKAGVGAVMASFNTVNDISMHAHKALITDTLKGTLNFDGIVVSDWKGYARFGEADVINAGIDMVMAVDGGLDDFQMDLYKAVKEDLVPIGRIDDAVKRILRQKFRLGLFDNPFPDKKLINQIGIQKHRDVARQAVRESLVLLKNKNTILPIDKKIKKIAVVGDFANSSGLQSGGWTIHWQGSKENYEGATTILEGVEKNFLGEIVFDPKGEVIDPQVELAIIVVGETPYAEFFGDIGGELDAYQHELTDSHQLLIQNYADKGIDIITILISGRPLVTTHQINQSNAFIAAWLPGSEGDGIAEVLFGDYNFVGKLPHSWPSSIRDYDEKYGPNYWDNSIKPLYPFGFGMTYSTREFQKIAEIKAIN